eukprot:TRINITY_DN375_c0_g1_i1.p1 TRINITY_DN375_c0_g1~~TRINITY_DN375_c0_g1_i1.p1  ORF type:complete len:144 (-),score=6.36 TRINITY_DN375_c0_g1_i1:488-919(-)
MRPLKFHEQKLLKKVDFLNWKQDNHTREMAIMRRYHITNRDDYVKYNKVCGKITKLVAALLKLPQDDETRIKLTEQTLEKCYNMGLITTKKSLQKCAEITASALCRRRLPIVLVRMKYAETVSEAVQLVEHGRKYICTAYGVA